MQHEVYALLTERCNEGATVFLSSHVLSEIDRYCKHAAVIREGKLLACDSVSRLSHTDAKRVTLGGVSQLDLPEACNIKYENGNVSFLYGGDVKELVKALGGIEFNDLTVENPDLDEIFLHFYKEDNK
jgi:ABC-2 type transport system ATP-binding protein